MPFDSENQPTNRKPRGKGKKTLFDESLERKGYTKADIHSICFDVILEQAKEGDKQAAVTLINMLDKPTKLSFGTYEFELDECATPIEQARSIVRAAANGETPPDVAIQYMDMVKKGMEILELSELAADVELIKESLKDINKGVQ